MGSAHDVAKDSLSEAPRFMTLLAEIQEVMERTYAPLGLNLEECLIGPTRSRELALRAQLSPEEVPEEGHTFLRRHDGNLYIAIYYAPEIISALEASDPREVIGDRNIRPLIIFIEELTHGLHAGLAFRSGMQRIESEQFACALEAQARVDTYYLLLRFVALLTGKPITDETRAWVKQKLYDEESVGYDEPRLAKRYRLAREIARNFVESLENTQLSPQDRVTQIRHFHASSLKGKLRLSRRIT